MATKTPSSSNPAFVPHQNQQWTQEYADGLRDNYANFRYQNYAIVGTIFQSLELPLLEESSEVASATQGAILD
jgi:hypothetical protein